jgi:hypothetical protein
LVSQRKWLPTSSWSITQIAELSQPSVGPQSTQSAPHGTPPVTIHWPFVHVASVWQQLCGTRQVTPSWLHDALMPRKPKAEQS